MSLVLLVFVATGCGDSSEPSSPTPAPQQSSSAEVDDDASANALPSPWPGDDEQTGIGVVCEGSGSNIFTIEMWKFGEDQEFTEFHTFDLASALAESIGSEGKDPAVLSGPCARRLQWSGDYRKALFSFAPDADASVRHVGVIDLETMKVTDLTGARQTDEKFGEEILSEEEAIFEIVGSRGDYSIDDGSVIISLPDEETRSVNGVEYSYLRVPVADPNGAEPATKEDARVNWFEALDLEGDWSTGQDHRSLGGSWLASTNGFVEDATAEGIDIASTSNETRGKRIACASENAGVGWIDDSRFVIWDGTKLSIMTVGQGGSARCSKSILPKNDYSIADLKLSPDGRYVYLGWVKGAAENSYRVPVDGGEAEPATVPEPPLDLQMFPRALPGN